MNFSDLLSFYDYSFPEELIAKEPASPRDSARLMIYNRSTQNVELDTFAKIISYLPENCTLVFNQTKVIPAKFTLKKETGGKIEALYLSHTDDGITVLASGSFKAGDALKHESGETFLVKERNEQRALIQNTNSEQNIISFLEEHGSTPLPPYIKESPLSEAQRRQEYQTTFAVENGSVAAPTAGLHFTKELITKIEQSGRSVHYITLHVGLGTFAPLTAENITSKKLHIEHYAIDSKTVLALNKAKKSGSEIIAVGTTTVRTLESASNGITLVRQSGSTDLFLNEDDTLNFVDALITNFHVPRSSLLMLVSAFTGREKLLELYNQAIEEKMRLFSFGDGMLIL